MGVMKFSGYQHPKSKAPGLQILISIHYQGWDQGWDQDQFDYAIDDNHLPKKLSMTVDLGE